MPNFAPVRAAWIDGPTVSGAETGTLDANTVGMLNADEGGTWAPTNPIVWAGAGAVALAPWFVTGNGALIRTPAGSGVRVVFGDNDYYVLRSGHTGSTQLWAQSFLEALAVAPAVASEVTDTFQSSQTLYAGTTLSLPLRVHHGARFTQVVFRFKVGAAHAFPPAALPKFRVVAIDATGVKTPCKTPSSGADANGWVVFPTPASGAAWYNAGAVHAVTLGLDGPLGSYVVVDTSLYTYVLEIVEESGANAFTVGAGHGNIWLSAVGTFTTIADLRPCQ